MKAGTIGFCVLSLIVLCSVFAIALGSRKSCCTTNNEGFYLPGDLKTYLGKDWGYSIPKAYYNPLAEKLTEDMLKQGLDPSCGCPKKPWCPYDWNEQPC